MNRVGEFEKISLVQYDKDAREEFNLDTSEDATRAIVSSYNTVVIPTRSTKGSAGYDIVTPISIELAPGQSAKIPTGLRCKIDEGWVLTIVPRSSVGFKHEVMLANTIGVIDSDYYFANNEGHIWLKLVNRGHKTWKVSEGDRIAQGIFLPYGITHSDDVDTERHGGIGSTGV